MSFFISKYLYRTITMKKLGLITFCITYFNWIKANPNQNQQAYLREISISSNSIKNQPNVRIRNDGVIIFNEDDINFLNIPDVNTQINKSKLNIWTTSREPDQNGVFNRFSFSQITPTTTSSNFHRRSIIVNYDLEKPKQIVHGFGGAITDAVMVNLNTLKSESLKKATVNLYFGKNSADYSLVRIPIGGCDFSKKFYTYQEKLDEACLNDKNKCKNDIRDFELNTWNLTELDHQKLNFMKEINQNSQVEVKYIAAPWSPPLWLKSNNAIKGFSTLKGNAGDEYHKTWANYLIKFLKEYADKGLVTSYLSSQNEPSHGYVAPGFWNTLGWSKTGMRDWIKSDLGPALDHLKATDTRFENLNLMIHDDVRIFYRNVETILDNADNLNSVNGVGIHWYKNSIQTGREMNFENNYISHFALNIRTCLFYQFSEKSKILIKSMKNSLISSLWRLKLVMKNSLWVVPRLGKNNGKEPKNILSTS